jgi:hypothetical protein
MNADYLWDKSGVPDQEIERLERILESLRYKPRTFAIPPNLEIEKRRNVFPLAAIAAMIMITLSSAALWISLNKPLTAEIGQLPLPVQALPTPITSETTRTVRRRPATKPIRVQTPSLAVRAERVKERQEAAAAKQQLMLALRLASSKLSLAQKRARGAPTLIRNQHKVG